MLFLFLLSFSYVSGFNRVALTPNRNYTLDVFNNFYVIYTVQLIGKVDVLVDDSPIPSLPRHVLYHDKGKLTIVPKTNKQLVLQYWDVMDSLCQGKKFYLSSEYKLKMSANFSASSCFFFPPNYHFLSVSFDSNGGSNAYDFASNLKKHSCSSSTCKITTKSPMFISAERISQIAVKINSGNTDEHGCIFKPMPDTIMYPTGSQYGCTGFAQEMIRAIKIYGSVFVVIVLIALVLQCTHIADFTVICDDDEEKMFNSLKKNPIKESSDLSQPLEDQPLEPEEEEDV